MALSLLKRLVKGSPLSAVEHDNNMTAIETAMNSKQDTIGLMAIGNINSPLLDMPLKNSLAMKAGVGSATFTRASIATYIDRYGVLKTAAIDEPRFEKEGYLNEGSSTNLITYSEQFDNAVWAKGTAVVTANTTETLDPYGTNLADKYVANAGNIAWLDQTISELTANTTYTLSTFIKPTTTGMSTWLNFYSVETGDLYAKFDFDTKTFTGHAVNVTKYGYKELSNGWFRLYLTIITGATVTSARIQPARYTVTSDGVKGYYVFGAQLEALPFATSYIPTVASTVTRSADILSCTLKNNSPKGTFAKTIMVDFLPKSLSASEGRIFDLQSISYNMIRLVSGQVQSFYGADSLTAYVPSTVNKTRWAYVVNNDIQDLSSNSISNYANGVLINTSVSGAVAQSEVLPVSIICIGQNQFNNGSDVFNGYITNVRIYNEALTAQEVALA